MKPKLKLRLQARLTPKVWNWLRFKLRWIDLKSYEALEFRKIAKRDFERDSLGLSDNKISTQNEATYHSLFSRVWPFGWGG